MYPGVPHSYPPNSACHMKRPFCGRFHVQLSIDTYACCHIHMLRSFCGVFHLQTGINAYSCCHITKTPKKTETKGEDILTLCSTVVNQPRRYARVLLGM